MDGWMEGWMDGWMSGWMSEWMDEWMGNWGNQNGEMPAVNHEINQPLVIYHPFLLDRTANLSRVNTTQTTNGELTKLRYVSTSHTKPP